MLKLSDKGGNWCSQSPNTSLNTTKRPYNDEKHNAFAPDQQKNALLWSFSSQCSKQTGHTEAIRPVTSWASFLDIQLMLTFLVQSAATVISDWIPVLWCCQDPGCCWEQWERLCMAARRPVDSPSFPCTHWPSKRGKKQRFFHKYQNIFLTQRWSYLYIYLCVIAICTTCRYHAF